MLSVSSSSFSLLAAAVAVACSSPPAPAPPEPEPEPVAAAPKEPADDKLPDTAAGSRLRWVLQVLNGEKPVPDAAEYRSIFAPAFVAKVGHDEFTQLAEQLRGAAPYELVGIKDGATDTRLVAVVSAKEQTFSLYLDASGDEQRIAGLFLRPEHDIPEISSWPQLASKLDDVGEHAAFIAARIDDGGRCVEIVSDEPDRQMAIGSTFKLYVLLALHRRIAGGELSWDNELAIRDEHKSLPSGTMQNLEAGTKKTLEEFALKMISISDNTATDHLLHHVGRERVERALKSTGHSAAEKNIPFLSTREFFALKLAVDGEARARYPTLSVGRKRRYVKEQLATAELSVDQASAWTSPIDIDTLEWFASPRDLCKVMAALRGPVDTSSELKKVLSANPGVSVDRKAWSYAGYKGGSEPGVMNLTWLLRHASGGWYALSVTVNDTNKPVDDGLIAALAQAALKFFGNQLPVSE